MLNVKTIEALKRRDKAYKVSDAEGLFLFVTTTGAKIWRLAYRFQGKQKELNIGPYPAIGLLDARKKRDDAKRLLANGIDPAAAKAEAKRTEAALRPFAEWADEWMEKQKNLQPPLSERTIVGKQRFVDYLKEEFGTKPLSEVKRSDVIVYLREFETEGTLENRDRVRSAGEKIFDYADLDGTMVNPFRNLGAQLIDNNSTPRPALTREKDVMGLFQKMAVPFERGRYRDIVGYALRFISLTVVRPGEIASAEWGDFDFTLARWTISAEKMKMDKEHVVPLSRQALALLEEVKRITGQRQYVFSATKDQPISDMALCRRLRHLGFDTASQHCAHGFRTTFSTLLNAEVDAEENKRWDADVIELQLAHLDESSVKSIYNRTGPLSLFAARARLMQHWSDRIDTMVGDNVVRLDKRDVA
jgi:integrase